MWASKWDCALIFYENLKHTEFEVLKFSQPCVSYKTTVS